MAFSPRKSAAVRAVLLLSFVGILIHSYLQAIDMLQYRTKIDVRIKLEMAPFPAVTVCKIESSVHSRFSKNGEEKSSDVEEKKIRVRDLIISGSFNREPIAMPISTEDFREFHELGLFGQCFTYNWAINEDVRSAWAGPAYGIRLLLNMSMWGSTQSGEVRITVQEQGVAPTPLQSSQNVPPGHVTSMAVKQKMIRRLGKPYGVCRVDDHGYQMKHTQEKCRSDCVRSAIFSKCDCTPPLNPFNLLMKYNPHGCNTTEKRACMEHQIRHPSCGCAPYCEESVFETTSSTSILPNIVTDCATSNVTGKMCTEYPSSDIAVVEVYYDQSHYEVFQEIPAYSLGVFAFDMLLDGILLLLIVMVVVIIPEEMENRKKEKSTDEEKKSLTDS